MVKEGRRQQESKLGYQRAAGRLLVVTAVFCILTTSMSTLWL
jgi:hypothetical protein